MKEWNAPIVLADLGVDERRARSSHFHRARLALLPQAHRLRSSLRVARSVTQKVAPQAVRRLRMILAAGFHKATARFFFDLALPQLNWITAIKNEGET